VKLEKTKECLEIVNCNLSGSSFRNVNLSNAVLDDVNLSHLKITNACMHDVSISDAMMDGMTINGIAVTELLTAYRAAQAGKS
jgi:uncharacterized protein YjbI with pentapeptide repeats